LRLAEFRQSEIEDLDPSISGHEEVLRLEIAVRYSFFMGGG
jgi:hypothetical protein